ncbi:MAG: hypothetical protein ACO1SV_03250 [Fimbriimonas sp.]
MNRMLLSLSGTFCLAASALTADSETTYQANISGVTGLYNASDVQTTSGVNIENVRYTLQYDVTHSTNGVFPFYYYYGPRSAGWITTLRVKFSNTNWQTAPSGSKVWVQVCNYIDNYDAPTNTSNLDAYEHDYFQAPNTVPLVTNGYSSIKTFYDVNPMAIDISSLSVDSSDLSGKTGKISWNSTSSSPTPWGNFFKISTQEVVTYANGSGTSFIGVVWAFARPTSNGTGGCSVTGRGITFPYVVPPDLAPTANPLSQALGLN